MMKMKLGWFKVEMYDNSLKMHQKLSLKRHGMVLHMRWWDENCSMADLGRSLTVSSRKDIKPWSSRFDQAMPVEGGVDTVGAALGQEIGVNNSFQRYLYGTIHGKLECLKSGSAIPLSERHCHWQRSLVKVSSSLRNCHLEPSVLSCHFSADFQGTRCNFNSKSGWWQGWDNKHTPPRCLWMKSMRENTRQPL